MVTQKTISIYTFDELTPKAKEKARQWYREAQAGDDWYESSFDDAKQIALLMGIDIKNIFFRGFSSQGDGACFEGSYKYAKGSVKAVKEYAPTDLELHRIATALALVQKEWRNAVSATVKHSGHYYHERCTDIDVTLDYSKWTDSEEATPDLTLQAETDITELLRDFMKWIYSQLEKESDFRESDETVDDNIRGNDYTFDVHGKREDLETRLKTVQDEIDGIVEQDPQGESARMGELRTEAETLEALRLLTRAVIARNDSAMTMHAGYAETLLKKPPQARTIAITVKGGMVESVTGLPEGWDYTVNDKDVTEESEGE